MLFLYRVMPILAAILLSTSCVDSGCDEIVVATPEIQSQPQSQIVTEGDSVTFRVGATASYYQWQKDGVDLDREFLFRLTIDNVSISDAGSYTVVVTNMRGGPCARQPKSLISEPAILKVIPKVDPLKGSQDGNAAKDDENSKDSIPHQGPV